MAEPMHLVVASGIDDTQRTLIHELVKGSTDLWWHGYPDVWMVSGGSAQGWREKLGVFVPKPPSGILVFRLPEEGKRAWSARGVKSSWGSLQEMYASPNGGPPKADAPPF